ncbi:MAG: hypothetical protein P8X80_11420 [Desulfobacterales bacterium]
MFKRLWYGDACHTLKSCVSVIFIGTVLSAMLVIIRLVGEKRLQRFLNFMLVFKRGEQPELELVSKSLAPQRRS